MRTWLVITLGIVAIAGGYMVFAGLRGHDQHGARRSGLFTHDQFVDGLYTGIDPRDSVAVFNYIFGQLPDEVTVYPSENYYYFKLNLHGYTFGGAIMLFSTHIDSGDVEFGYSVRVEDKVRQKDVKDWGAGCLLNSTSGMYVEKIDPFNYRLTYNGRSVLFKLYRDRIGPPLHSRLMANEICVGPSFDDSGLKFYLIYNKANKGLFWILNEDGFVPERLRPFGRHGLMGERTGFVFFNDSSNQRRILVGVDGYNILQNNWFDGPFDQMPDNYVKAGLITVKPYLDAHYNLADDAIDQYGHFKGTTGSRVPVAPYTVYFKKADLRFIDSLSTLNLAKEEYIHQITRQRYDVPKDLNY